MRKIITGLMCLIPITTLYADNDLTHKWFISGGASVYSITDVQIDVAGRKTSEFYRDKFPGYSVGLGHDWEWIAAGMYFSGFSVSRMRGQTLTGRVMMQIFPLDNLPYLLMEYGMIQVNNSDLHLHKRTGMFGVGGAVRFDVSDSFFLDAGCIYNQGHFDFNVSDVPVSLRAKRWNMTFSVGYWF